MAGREWICAMALLSCTSCLGPRSHTATATGQLPPPQTAEEWLAYLAVNRIEPRQLARQADGTYRVDVSESALTNLWPLARMPISHLECKKCPVSDLAPLAGMRSLRVLDAGGAAVSDLAALRGLKLAELHVWDTPVADLAPLKGMPLETLNAGGTKVSDLAPLRGMSLRSLSVYRTGVADLAPLKGLPLRYLDIRWTPVRDLSPLAGLPIEHLRYSPETATNGFEALRAARTLRSVNERPVGREP